MVLFYRAIIVILGVAFSWTLSFASNVEVKGLGRFDGWRDNHLIGYGMVVGLSGSGDSRRSYVTQQSLSNVYGRMGVNIDQDDVSSRNVAVVMVTGTLPPSANVGDKINITVASTGDARSLAGGVLVLTPLLGPDGKDYAVAQGPLITGGFNFESEGSFQQRNFPTTARIEKGATVERSVHAKLLNSEKQLSFYLHDPDFKTASDIADAINERFVANTAWAVSADEVRIRNIFPDWKLTNFVSIIQSLVVEPQTHPRVVINERTGTVVAGADVKISPVVISQGGVRVTVRAENRASQPQFIGGISPNTGSLIIRNTELQVQEHEDVVANFENSSIADLVMGLNEAGVDTKEMIAILQAMREAGALHAQIIVQ